jgi:hypothetical protein
LAGKLSFEARKISKIDVKNQKNRFLKVEALFVAIMCGHEEICDSILLSKKWCSQNRAKGKHFVSPPTPKHLCLDFVFC